MKGIEKALVAFSNFVWGTPLLILLLGGGFFFLIFSRFAPFKHFGHAINILRGKYDDPDDPGELSHFKALSGALAATVGLGNISGVAVAIAMGGPGALFWMWVSAFVGMATKFFTCTLSIMYRGKDTAGEIQGGPMYVIQEGMGRKWNFLAVIFCLCGLFGTLPIFQANQLIQSFREVIAIPAGWLNPDDTLTFNLVCGVVLVALVSMVIFGGIKRIGSAAAAMVPAMVVLYFGVVLFIILKNAEQVPSSFSLIFSDAFKADAALGGALGALIITGARRAAFSNEAGIGTAPMMHGAARTKEPVREGLVAMLGPFIDTIVVCTLTALAIIVTGVWKGTDLEGVSMTARAFEIALPGVGNYLLILCVLIFGVTSLFSYSYYGTKCLNFLAGAKYKFLYNYFYVITIIFGSVSSITAVISLIDSMYAIMAFPTMISALALAPKVRSAARDYFSRMKKMGSS